MSGWYERVQGATKTEATANGEAWDAESLEMVIAFTNEVTDEDLAFTLGRTLASITNIQYRLRHEGVDPVRAAYAARNVVAREVGYDFVNTFPVGWND
jgi:hypothetical protein